MLYPTSRPDQFIYWKDKNFILIKSRIGKIANLDVTFIHQIIALNTVKVHLAKEIEKFNFVDQPTLTSKYYTNIKGIFIDDAHGFSLKAYSDLVYDKSIKKDDEQLFKQIQHRINEEEFWLETPMHDVCLNINIIMRSALLSSDYFDPYNAESYETIKKELFWKEI